MTREEAIEVIKAYRDKLTHSVSNQLDGDIEAFSMTIKALEQKPKTMQEIQAESEKYQKAFEDGYEQGYAQARFDYEQEPILDKIRAEIEELDRYYDNDYFSTNNCPMYKCNEVLQIIDKYRGESDCRECKAEHDCYECKKYTESEET